MLESSVRIIFAFDDFIGRQKNLLDTYVKIKLKGILLVNSL